MNLKSHEELIGIPENHTLVKVDMRSKIRKGWDTDYYTLEEHDDSGNVVAKYEVEVATKMYPPFNTTQDYRKI